MRCPLHQLWPSQFKWDRRQQTRGPAAGEARGKAKQKQVQPDPCDWQIIACSNCLQCIACILDIIAVFVSACPVTHAGSE